jgi:CheY-like chemotaxis protein
MRVLIVDDTVLNHMVLGRVCRSLPGVEVTAVISGEKALEVVAAEPPFDLILMDVHMPGRDGLETTAELRRRGCTATIAATTSDDTPEMRARCLASGMDLFIGKTADRGAIERALSHSE